MFLREARNVDEVKTRDALVRRIQRLRAQVLIDIDTIAYWNQLHPEAPLSDAFERQVLAHLDGKGPMPTLPEAP